MHSTLATLADRVPVVSRLARRSLAYRVGLMRDEVRRVELRAAVVDLRQVRARTRLLDEIVAELGNPARRVSPDAAAQVRALVAARDRRLGAFDPELARALEALRNYAEGR